MTMEVTLHEYVELSTLFSLLLLLHHDSLGIFPFQLRHVIRGHLISYCAKHPASWSHHLLHSTAKSSSLPQPKSKPNESLHPEMNSSSLLRHQ
ncbi:hypothetical protein V8C34DRAFT_94532 [Trichoderma compactum]